MSLAEPETPSSSIVTRAQTRKRTMSGSSTDNEESREVVERKRPRISNRLSAMFAFRSSSAMRMLPSNLSYPDRMPSISRDDGDFFAEPQLPTRPSFLSASASFSARSLSRQSSVSSTSFSEGLSLMRSLSSSSLPDIRAAAAATPPMPEESAGRHLRSSRMTIDFSASEGAWPVSWSEQNLIVFGRMNRVFYKNMSANEAVGQLCKLPEEKGALRMVQCGEKDQPHAVAVSMVSGAIEVYDLATKKRISRWSAKSVTAMQWNGPVLSVGGDRGVIKHYDTRIGESSKMKEQAKKVTRHQTRICSLSWNCEGKLYASGDESGIVHVWDARQNAPLDVGELIQRRKKIQHVGPVHALAWCPWQPKVLATGDSAPDGSGTIRIWNVNSTNSNSPFPTKLELDAQVTSLHFSAHCKELLSTHGPGKSKPAGPPPSHLDEHTYQRDDIPSRIANAVVVHSFPGLQKVIALEAARSNIAGSVLSPTGQRLVLAVPMESKLQVWDIWGKRKDLRRTTSSLDMCKIRLR